MPCLHFATNHRNRNYHETHKTAWESNQSEKHQHWVSFTQNKQNPLWNRVTKGNRWGSNGSPCFDHQLMLRLCHLTGGCPDDVPGCSGKFLLLSHINQQGTEILRDKSGTNTSARQWAVLAHFCGQPQGGSVCYSQRTMSSQLLQQCWLIEAAQLAKACSWGDQTVQQPRLADCTDALLPMFRAPACSPSRALSVQSSIFVSVLPGGFEVLPRTLLTVLYCHVLLDTEPSSKHVCHEPSWIEARDTLLTFGHTSTRKKKKSIFISLLWKHFKYKASSGSWRLMSFLPDVHPSCLITSV